MDLRLYYKNVRDVEAEIPGEFAVIVSLKTVDGGKPGVMSEVTRHMAARWVSDNRARLATEEETRRFYGETEATEPAAEGGSGKGKAGKE